MIRALLSKELRQHGFAIAFLLLLPFAGLILIFHHGLLRRAGGAGFEAVRVLLLSIIPLACVVLGQLLIAQEFRQKTQLFLEGLPLPRWRMLAVKFCLGAGLVLLVAVLALTYVGWNAWSTEAMTPRFAGLLLAKAAAWCLCLYTFFFAHAFLGRYRLVFGIAVLFGMYATSTFDLQLSEYGPFALVDQRFSFERFVWPKESLVATGGLILLFTGMGFFLGLVRDATVAAMLAEKMSAREKLFLTFVSLVLLMVTGEVNERRKYAQPVQMPGATEADRSVVRVLASAAVDAPTRAETAALKSTATGVAVELEAVTGYLGCRSYPPVFIVHRRDLTGGEITDGGLKAAQGVMVRANLVAPDFKPEALQERLVHETLVAQTNGLVERERNDWILDGFEWWWPRSKHGEASAWRDAVLAVRSASKPMDFTPQKMHTWLTVKKDLGPKQAAILAGSVLAFLAESRGTASLRHFLADRLGEQQPADSRAWWHDLLRPNGVRLRAATGWSEAELSTQWRKAIRAAP